MKQIRISADGYRLKPEWVIAGTAGSRGMTEMVFDFSDDWDGLTRTVTFYPPAGGEACTLIMLGNSVTIPGQVLTTAGTASYVVDGVRDNRKLISLEGRLRVFETRPGGGSPAVEPVPTQLEQLRTLMQNTMAAAEGKADLVSDATEGNVAALDSDGNLTDSGVAAADLLTSHPEVTLLPVADSSASPASGESFTVYDGITRDANGHVTALTRKTITLPSNKSLYFGEEMTGGAESFEEITAAGTYTVPYTGVYILRNTDPDSETLEYCVDPEDDAVYSCLFDGESASIYLPAGSVIAIRNAGFEFSFFRHATHGVYNTGDVYINQTTGDIFRCTAGNVNGRAQWTRLGCFALPYDTLTGKPSVNGVGLSGDRTAEELGLESGGAVVAHNADPAAHPALFADKADIGGCCPQLTAGYAENLVWRKDAVNGLVGLRTAGGMEEISDGTATIERVRGNTLLWNQLLNTSDIPATRTVNGITFTNNGDGTVTVNGTATAQADFGLLPGSVTAGHKYALCGCPAGGMTYSITPGSDVASADEELYVLRCYSSQLTIVNHPPFDSGSGTIVTPNTDSLDMCITVYSGATVAGLTFRPQLIDLTRMFGAGGEPERISDFRELFPRCHYPYDSGSLVNLTATGIKSVGFNAYNPAAGYARVLGCCTYYIGGTYTALGFTDTVGGATSAVTPTDGLYVPDVNGYLYVTGGASDTCVNLSWSDSRNGEYEEYREQTRDIPIAMYFPDGMRSVGAVYDELRRDRAITRIGSRAYTDGDENDAAVITDGVNTYYVLAEPVEVAISPELNLVYTVSGFGTEEAVGALDGTTPVMSTPLNIDVVYGLNATDILRGLPDNYVAKEEGRGLSANDYTDAEKEALADLCDNQYELIESIVTGYSVTAAQPADWDTAYTSYFTNTGTARSPVYTAVTGDVAPEWAANTYYSYSTSGTYGITREAEPDGAAYNFKSLCLVVNFPWITETRNIGTIYLQAFNTAQTKIDQDVYFSSNTISSAAFKYKTLRYEIDIGTRVKRSYCWFGWNDGAQYESATHPVRYSSDIEYVGDISIGKIAFSCTDTMPPLTRVSIFAIR